MGLRRYLTTQDPLASGDLIAGRRFAYARAAAEEGDFSAAAELFEQTLERAPRSAGAWFALAKRGRSSATSTARPMRSR